ncbi:FAD/NAD(P)-binding protein [Rugamonas sp. A1-17]|nr:FAD/NAD(P)-binding protein [Rugamonas sp. A1-17]
MKRYSVTIIGMGPRGLSAFERLAAAAASLQLPLDLNLIEPGDCGPGVHSTRQPQHLLINTIASQVTLFPAPGVVQHAPVCATPSLTAWARQQGYRRVGERYYRLDGHGGAEITEADYLPRSLLGEYLAWAYRQIAAALPSSVRLTHHRLRATDLWRQADGRHTVELETGYLVQSDFVVLTTGHGRNQPGALDAKLAAFAQEHARHNSRLAFVRHAYPLTQLDGIGAGTRVAIQGLGLSAHDIIAELTVGRGGAFVQGEDGLRYERSGGEPQLTLCSRNCLPAAARGVNQKGLDGRHQPRYFTPDAVDALRRVALATRGSRQLDFERELLPLLKREMGWVYRGTLATAAPDGAAPDPARYMLSADDSALIDQLLFPLRGREFASLDEFRQFFAGWLRDDLAEARLGNVGSAVKAATDVLRDVRATLQAAVEHGGLTPASHRQFLEVYHPAINRVAFGPPLRRNQELLALLDAGVLEIASGPGGTIELDEQNARYVLSTGFGDSEARHQADVLVVARLDAFFPELDDSLLIRNVLKRGLARPYYNGAYHPGGLDIDAAGQPRDDFGQPSRNLWALGYLVEGAHYYTHALPRPGMRSRQVLDADRCVHAMLARMDAVPLPETRHATVPAPSAALPHVTL